jgi:hypothetical protein
MSIVVERLAHVTTACTRWFQASATTEVGFKHRQTSVVAGGAARLERFGDGTTLALANSLLPSGEGRTHMPLVRLKLARFIGASLLALACGGLSAASAQPASSAAASPLSGTYIGAAQHISGSEAPCEPGGQVKIDVRDGHFRFPWHEPQAFNVRISPDGSFFATSGDVLAQSDKHMKLVPTMQGHVSEASLVADYGTRWCRYRLEAVRS